MDAELPSGVLFTSFVGPGRRSFNVLVAHNSPTEWLAASSEALCRRAIGHVVRDRLYDKTGTVAVFGDHIGREPEAWLLLDRVYGDSKKVLSLILLKLLVVLLQ